LFDFIFPDLKVFLLQTLHETVVVIRDGCSDKDKSYIEIDPIVLRNAEKTGKQQCRRDD
jgi:hypothetical protein